MSTTSAPVRRRDASPSSSTDRVQYQSHQSHGHHHGHHHHSGHPRSLSEPSAGTGLSASQIAHAARMPLVRENGVRVLFGELWRAQRTAVFFIRHFWCPLCQDYLASLMRDVDHAALARAGVRVVVIGCGSYSLIRPYRQIFHLPYELLVDASSGQALYRALGMGRLARGNNGGGGAGAGTGAGKPGAYVRHGAVSGLAMVVGHALRVGMPPWERGGDATQLGGEFVFGPGLSCTYAHRMQSAAGHAPVVDVLAAAGVRGVHKGAAAAATTAPSIRRNISLPLERPGAVVATGTAAGRDTKVLSVVREEGCAGDGVCGADSVSVDWESTTSGEWGLVAAHGHGATR
ncbi:AhpC/TSA antioxidant enzyme-domain-containing protein [Gloeopeniophorella convolvens]|nr:AhpC/TSA antioxidant enzyme-domain-containing protein [Gloeopeniophorella convolvens]